VFDAMARDNAETRLIMGMPITVDIVDAQTDELRANVFRYFEAVDRNFSPYIESSEVCCINRGEVAATDVSDAMGEVLSLAEDTRVASNGFFNVLQPDGTLDPSGIVKGWAIGKAAAMIEAAGAHNFYVEAGGDIQAKGMSADGSAWRVGIRSPFAQNEIIKVVELTGAGIATSGAYARGAHIYNPHDPKRVLNKIVSMTVVAKSVVDADRFATAAFAMGPDGIYFIEALEGVEGYAVDAEGMATETTGFGVYVAS
jgi:FAD:protein FMN transferase